MPVVSIVIAGNSGFIVPLTACVRCMFYNTPHACLTVLDCGLTRSDQDQLRRTAEAAVSVRFVKVIDHDFNSLPHPICDSWATYAQLLGGDLPLDSSIVLYLDSDAMLLQDVSALFVEDFGKNASGSSQRNIHPDICLQERDRRVKYILSACLKWKTRQPY